MVRVPDGGGSDAARGACTFAASACPGIAVPASLERRSVGEAVSVFFETVRSLTEGREGLRTAFAAIDLTPGEHGVHLHDVGLCEGPKFESAGPHWNPATKQHGKDNPQGPHGGDLDNLLADAGGKGAYDYVLAGVTRASLADANGTALVIHAKADDYKTDPSGDSGDRIACAVVAPPAAR